MTFLLSWLTILFLKKFGLWKYCWKWSNFSWLKYYLFFNPFFSYQLLIKRGIIVILKIFQIIMIIFYIFFISTRPWPPRTKIKWRRYWIRVIGLKKKPTMRINIKSTGVTNDIDYSRWLLITTCIFFVCSFFIAC